MCCREHRATSLYSKQGSWYCSPAQLISSTPGMHSPVYSGGGGYIPVQFRLWKIPNVKNISINLGGSSHRKDLLTGWYAYLGDTWGEVVAGTIGRRVEATSWCRGVVDGLLSWFCIRSSLWLATCPHHKRSKVSWSILQFSLHCLGFSFSNVVFLLNLVFSHRFFDHISSDGNVVQDGAEERAIEGTARPVLRSSLLCIGCL